MSITIEKNSLLLVEGKDENVFFNKFLQVKGLTDSIQIIPVGGKDRFRNEMKLLVKATGFYRVNKIGIIRDADDNVQNAFASIKGMLKVVELDVPSRLNLYTNGKPQIGVYIMPDNENPGMLEDLCLKTVKDHDVMDCANEFIVCLKDLEKDPKNESKAKAQVFLAAMPNIVNSVGLGAEREYWDLSSPELNDLAEFIAYLK